MLRGTPNGLLSSQLRGLRHHEYPGAQFHHPADHCEESKIMHPKYWKHAMLVATGLLLAACATTPQVSVVGDPQAEFSRYATYSFAKPLGTDRGTGVSTVLSNLLRSLARTEMDSRGFSYVETGGDLEVNFFVETQEKIETRYEPGWGMHYGYWNYPYGVWTDYDHTRIRQYTVGTLHLDIVDMARKQLIWEAIAQGRVKTDFTYEQDDVRAAMKEMFTGFPQRTAATP
jgi:hypothetical protein